MANPNPSSSLFRTYVRPETLAALLGCASIILILVLFQSIWAFAGLLVCLVGITAFWFGFEYIPLVLFLQLALSFEIQISATTRLTVPTEFLIPALFLAFGITLFLKGKFTYRPSALNVAVILLFSIMVISVRYSLVPLSSIKAVIRDTGYIGAGYFLIPRYIRSEKHLRQILVGCLGIHTFLVFYGFLTQIVGGFRIYGNIAHPFFVEHCIYAAFLTFSFAFILAFYLSVQSGRQRFWLGFLTCLFGAAILLTFVRAAWISVFFLLLYYLFQFRKYKSAVDIIIFMILGILLGIGIALTTDVGNLLVQRLDTITDTQYSANLDRIDRWLVASQMWNDHPYFGVGWGAYPDVYFQYSIYNKATFDPLFQRAPFAASFRMGAHNIYLEMLAEVGLVGLLLFLLMIYLFFRRAIVLQYQLKNPLCRIFLIGAQGAMITYLIHAFVNNLGPSDKISLTFWFILGMIPTLEAMHRMELSNAPRNQSGSETS